MLLAIDTSQANLMKLWLYKDKEPKDYFEIATEKGQLEELLAAIDELLIKNKAGLGDLRAIAVNPGPGTYTGLRIGVTTANTLAWSLDVPIYGFSGELSTLDLEKIFQTSQKFSLPVSPHYGNTLD